MSNLLLLGGVVMRLKLKEFRGENIYPRKLSKEEKKELKNMFPKLPSGKIEVKKRNKGI